MVTADSVEHLRLNTDTRNILNLIINHCYPVKDVFLRELVSNASDACDKIRFESITNDDILKDGRDLKIRIVADKEAKKLHIFDTGIGMTKQELIKNIGTIARSGTKRLLESMAKSDANKVNLIGQFGIGFYSSFLVADNVQVITKSPRDDVAYKWESDGSVEYTISPVENSEMPRGTHIILDIKEGNEEFLKETTLENTVKKHSNYIPYPIYLQVHKQKEVEDDEDEEDEAVKEDKEKEADQDGKIEEVKDEAKPKKKKTVHYNEDKHINCENKIWDKDPSEVTDEDAEKAYKQLTKSWQKPRMYKVCQVEGATDFALAIYIHDSPKTEIFESKGGPGPVHARLYNKGVFLMDCDSRNPLIAEKSVQSIACCEVNTELAPQGISRDRYHSANFTKLVGKYYKRKLIQMIDELKTSDAEKYQDFKKKHSSTLKLAVYEDSLMSNKWVEHVSFESTLNEKEEITLQQYVEAMKPNQTKIFYAIGSDRKDLMEDSLVKECIAQGKHVIFFYSQIDEIMFNKMKEFMGKSFQDIRKEGFELFDTEEKKKSFEELKQEYEEFRTKVKGILGSRVSDVKIGMNTTEPVVIQVPDYALSPQMEIMHENQPLTNNAMSFFNSSSKTLVFNPFHDFTKEVKDLVMGDSPIVNEFVLLLCNWTLYRSGYPMKDQRKEFGEQVFKMMSMAIGTGSGKIPSPSTPNASNQNDVSKSEAETAAADSSLNEVD